MPRLLIFLFLTWFAQGNQPNIVLIMVDDMGFSDLGCYGGEIETPHLDSLAQNGLRFTQFYNTGRCCPTRASLLTGLYPHQAGIGHMSDNRGFPGYLGHLNEKCLTLAEALKPAGYFTTMAGKWHVGSDPKYWPRKRGFDRFYGTPQGGGHHYRNLPNRSLVLNDEEIPMPDDWYSTTAFTDHALRFLDEGFERKQPVLLYLAYTAPHWPLQAPPETIARFRGRYRKGWQAIREARFKRQMEMGLFPPGTRLAPPAERVPSWSSVTDKEEVDLRLATHAAMVHLVDQGVGRIVKKLSEKDQLANTLILFLSDNGASAEAGPLGFTGNRGGDPKAKTGTPDSYNSFGISGANMSDTPFRKFKRYTHEGGIATPLIAHWPKGIPTTKQGTMTREVGHVIDFLPTFLDLAGASYPNSLKGQSTTPLAGRSLKPVFQGKPLTRPEGLYFEHEGHAAIRIGEWKLVRTHRRPWSLYDLTKDRTELTDLAQSQPQRVAEMKARWQTWADQSQVKTWPLKKKKETRK
jgi:arylsulfatase